MIKTSKLPLDNNNTGKLEIIDLFLTEYRKALIFYINYFWKKERLHKPVKSNVKTYKFYPFKPDYDTILSGRALKAVQTQAMGMINAALRKQENRYYMLAKLQNDGNDTRKLQKKISSTIITKPKVPTNIKAELNSNNITLVKSNTAFDICLKLASLFNKQFKKDYTINNKWFLLFNKNRHYNKLESKGKVMNSFLLSRKFIDVRFDIKQQKIKSKGNTIAIDQGITNVISGVSSDNNTFESKPCPHGHTLTSIINKLNRCKKGSKGFKRTQEHRKNYIHWCINQLDLSNTKEMRVEKLYDMRRGKRTSKFLNAFTYPLIRAKLKERCDSSGVRFVEQSNKYRSQRCSSCGFVHKDNRKGKTFFCIKCNYTNDSDVNAASNHLVDLPPIYSFVHKEAKKSGFYWNLDGILQYPQT